MTKFLSRAEAAEYVISRGLQCSKHTLQKWVTVGGGPDYRIFGNKAVYTAEDIDAWIEKKLSPVRHSDVEPKSAAPRDRRA